MITVHYHIGLLGLSLAVATTASYVACLRLDSLLLHPVALTQRLGIIVVGATMGFGGWSTHLLAVQAMGFRVQYNGPMLGLALLLGIAGALPALYLAVARPASRYALALAGLCLGGGMTLLHNVAMAAATPTLRYHPSTFSVVAAVAVGTLGSAISLLLVTRNHRHLPVRVPAASLLLGLTLTSMHGAAMAGSNLVLTGAPWSQMAVWLGSDLSTLVLGVGTLLILGLSLVSGLIDRQLQGQVTVLGRRHQLILDAAGDGIYGLDEAGRTTFVNPAAARMLGYEPAELIGRPMHDLLHHKWPDGSAFATDDCPILLSQRTGQPTTSGPNEVFWRKDGSAFPVEYVSTPIREGNRMTGTVVVFKDVTLRLKAEQALREQEAARERDLARARFLQIAAHELRNPMAAVKGMLALQRKRFERGVPPQDWVPLNAPLEREIDRLSTLLSEVLDAFRAEQGRLPVNPVPMDLTALVKAVTRPYSLGAVNHRFVLDLSAPGTLWINGDPRRLEQVLRQLLSNAVKFSPDGGDVTVRLVREAETAVLTVIDSGTGFDPEEAERLFEGFFRTEHPGDRDPGGLGLGLYISRAIVECHAGRIWAQRAGKRGAVFCVELPLLPGEYEEELGHVADSGD